MTSHKQNIFHLAEMLAEWQFSHPWGGKKKKVKLEGPGTILEIHEEGERNSEDVGEVCHHCNHREIDLIKKEAKTKSDIILLL